MRWGHAISRDLLAWTHLPVAINHWDGAFYDCQPWPAIFSGSVTMVDENPVVFYSVPCQTWINGAVPLNRSDPLLVDWQKLGPIMNASDSVTGGSGLAPGGQDFGTTFRDPTSAWKDETDGNWYTATACMNGTCLFRSDDSSFKHWESAGWFHRVDKSGTWECPDVFKMPGTTDKYVLKANNAQGSACVGDAPNNWWSIGTFDPQSGFSPITADICGTNFSGIGNHFDATAHIYASKSFYDSKNDRQVCSRSNPRCPLALIHIF
jgi:sucrose-6-phosphate hydrolase SacC (GH32 family)